MGHGLRDQRRRWSRVAPRAGFRGLRRTGDRSSRAFGRSGRLLSRASESEVGSLYLEDVVVGDVLESRWYEVDRDEIVEFARRWDPQPFHLDEEAGRASIFGGLAACAPHLFAILSRLAFELPGRLALVAGLGGDGLQLRAPVLAGTEIRLRRRFTAARASHSRPGMGVVSFADVLEDRDGRVVFETAGSVLIKARSHAVAPQSG